MTSRREALCNFRPASLPRVPVSAAAPLLLTHRDGISPFCLLEPRSSKTSLTVRDGDWNARLARPGRSFHRHGRGVSSGASLEQLSSPSCGVADAVSPLGRGGSTITASLPSSACFTPGTV